MKIIKVSLKENPYNIYIEYNLAHKLPLYLKELNLGNFAIVITSPTLQSKYKNLIKAIFKDFSYKIVEVADGEEAKSEKWLFRAIEKIVNIDAWNKKLFIVCLGGGTIGDLGGFIASIYKRGIPYVQIPTTLLSQIDASIGGKTGIDLSEAKNILGTFYQPKAIFIDPAFLSTLESKEIKEGIAEAIKYAIIKRRDFFFFLKKNYREIMKLEPACLLKMISACVQIKAKVVQEDEKEKKGIRTILNFGHTLAHALETSKGYKTLSHGEAVSLGILYAAQLSYSLGMCNRRDFQEIYDILRCFRLPIKISFNYLNVYKIMSYDKKFISGKARLVLLRRIGKATVVDNVSSEKILKSLKIFSCVN